MTVVSGYNVKVRKVIIDRWQELERGAKSTQPQIPQTLPEALRLAADLADQKAQTASTMPTSLRVVSALALG